jgi:hypothetical protein
MEESCGCTTTLFTELNGILEKKLIIRSDVVLLLPSG